MPTHALQHELEVSPHLHAIVNDLLLLFDIDQTVIAHSLRLCVPILQLDLLVGAFFAHQAAAVATVVAATLEAPVVVAHQTAGTVVVSHPLDLIVGVGCSHVI